MFEVASSLRTFNKSANLSFDTLAHLNVLPSDDGLSKKYILFGFDGLNPMQQKLIG
jgi:hypothetical protein